MADGSIRIETKLDNSALKQQIKELERELKNIQKEQAKTEAQASQVKAKYDAEREFDSQMPDEFSHREDIDKRAAGELDPIIAKQEELNQKEQQYLAMLDAAKAKLAEQANVMSASKQVDDAVRTDTAMGKVQSQAQYNSLLEATAAKMSAIEAAAGRVAAQTGISKDQILAANPAYQKLSDTMSMLKAKAADFGKEGQEAGKKTSKAMKDAEKSTKKVGTATKQGIAGFGRMGLAMMAIRFAMRSISAATREYMATNSQMEGQMNTLKSLWGQVLGPAIQYVINLLMQAVSAVNAFVYALTGINFVARANEAALKKQAKATTTAAKAQRQLAGFDEQTKLADTSGGGGGGTSSPVAMLDDGLGAMPDFMKKLVEQFKNGDWYGAGITVGETIMEAIESVDWKKLGSKVGEILGGIIGFAAGLFVSIDPITIFEKVRDALTGLFNSISKEIQKVDWKAVGNKLIDWLLVGLAATNPVTAILSMMLTPGGEEFTQATSGFVGSVVGALAAAIVGAYERIKEIAVGLWNAFKGFFDDYVDWDDTPHNIWLGIQEGIVAAIKNIGKWVYDNIWVPFRDAFKEAFGIHSPSTKMEEFGGYMIAGLVNGIKNAISKVVSVCKEVWTAVKDVFSSVGTWFKEKFNMDAVRDGIKGAISKITSACKEVWSAIKNVFSSVGTWFKDTFSNAWKKVKEVFSSGGKIFDGIKDGISSAFKTIVNKLIDGINKIIKTPFDAINKMLNTIRSVKVLGVTPFKNLWSQNPLSVPKIPKLAVGGIVNRPGRGVPAIIGEAGAEAVLPLENNTEWMDILADKIGGGNITIPITLDGKRIATYVVDIQKKKAFAMNGA